jgi:hypothetical protein
MSLKFELSGKLHKKMDTQQITATFEKREFVVETAEQYPQQVKFELKNDKTALIDDISEGEQIKVHFNINGREWNGKYFVNLQAWKIEAAEEATEKKTPSAPPSTPAAKPEKKAPSKPAAEADDELPF